MRRRLGRTGIEVFPIGVGGHTYPVGDGPECFATPDERARLVRGLVDGGVNYFDTTWLNEVQVLADSFRRAGVRADADAVVSLQHVDGISDPEWRAKLRPEIETRLAVMGWPRAPLFLMGVGNGKPPLAEIIAALEAMDRLRDEGLLGHIGVSCHELGHFAVLAEAIERTDLVDCMMIRFNPKFRQAGGELFEAARRRDVGVVAMKVFCWDCGPGQWDRRISVFEPVPARSGGGTPGTLTPAQKSLVWTLQNSPAAVAVPAINAGWEAEECLAAAGHLAEPVDAADLAGYTDRLWSESELEGIASGAESRAIRDRARVLLRG